MRFDKVIELIAVTYASDAIGQEVATKTPRTVFANEFAVGSSEFYDAGRSGLKAERQYQVRSVDYNDEALLAVDGVEYTIIRPARRGEWTTLTCERAVANEAEASVS
jgi:SPP1 family predicted phage head-tail adaptor